MNGKPPSSSVFYERLVEELEQDPRIVFAYLFGSRATGREQKSSDLDLAVYINQALSADEYLELVNGLSNRSTFEVDLIILNDAGPVLRHQVFRDGKLLVNKEEVRHARFRVESMRAYYEYLEINGLIPEEDRF